MNKTILSGFGGLTAAFGSMLCCTGPLVLASLGLSGAALSAWRPWRPLFVVVSVGLFILAFQMIGDLEAPACEPGDDEYEEEAERECAPCADPARTRRTKRWLYLIAAVSFLLLISPRWAPLVF
jgi:mercuric ion transport protein